MRPNVISLMRRAIRQAEEDARFWAAVARGVPAGLVDDTAGVAGRVGRGYAADAQRHRARLAALTGGRRP